MQCSSVSALPSFERLVLLVRHAERYSVTDMRTHSEVMLTDQGKADAVAFGSLAARLGDAGVWHSPVPRCRQTAESLARGIADAGGRGSVEGPLDWLLKLVTTDFGWAGERIRELGHEGFVRTWFDGGYGANEITPMRAAATGEMKCVLRQLEESPSPVAIDVTHDWHLLVLREHYLHLRHEDVGIPPYLDSVAVFRTAAGIFLWSLGRSVQVDDVPS